MHASLRALGPAVICLGAAIMLATTAMSAEPDHLKGYKIRDLNKLNPPVANIVADQFGSGICSLKKAQFLLAPAAQDNGDDPRGGPAGYYLCYSARCTSPVPPPTNADTQIGTVKLATKRAELVCLPANPAICGDGNLDPGEMCDPPGSTSQCAGAVACSTDCTCPQPCTGQVVGGSCWFLGADGASCDATCAGAGGTCDSATITYAGSEGTQGNCGAILSALGITDLLIALDGCAEGLGCADDPEVMIAGYCHTPATTCAAAYPNASRACACH